VNSFQKVVRRGVHQGLNCGEGQEKGAEPSIVVVRAERAEEKHWSSLLGEGAIGGSGTTQLWSLFVTLGQSASCQCGLGLSLWGEGGWRESKIGAWSASREEREDALASHERKAGKI